MGREQCYLSMDQMLRDAESGATWGRRQRKAPPLSDVMVVKHGKKSPSEELALTRHELALHWHKLALKRHELALIWHKLGLKRHE